MEAKELDVLIGNVSTSFLAISQEIAALHFEECDFFNHPRENKIAVFVGIVGKYKGRIIFTGDESAITTIAEGMNGEPLNDISELHFGISEFTNIFCGKAITCFNNHYQGYNLRMAPPAISFGSDIDVATPKIHSHKMCYAEKCGTVTLDIGFELEENE